jgi:hypothetical protein
MSGDINRRLDGNGHAMQRPELSLIPVENCLLGGARLGEYCFRLAIDKRVQPGIEALDAIEVSARHLHRRNRLLPDVRSNFPRGQNRA